MLPPDGRAPRIRGAGLRDPRLISGVVAILASMAIGGWAFTAMERTEAFYVAKETIAAGSTLDASMMSTARLRLAEGLNGANYWSADEPLPAGLIALRSLASGDLLARSAIGTASDLASRPIVITPGSGVPAELAVGRLVDMWIDSRFLSGQTVDRGLLANADGPPGEYVVLARDLELTGIGESSALNASATSIEVMVPVDHIPIVLAALDSPEAIRIVLVPGGRS